MCERVKRNKKEKKRERERERESRERGERGHLRASCDGGGVDVVVGEDGNASLPTKPNRLNGVTSAHRLEQTKFHSRQRQSLPPLLLTIIISPSLSLSLSLLSPSSLSLPTLSPLPSLLSPQYLEQHVIIHFIGHKEVTWISGRHTECFVECRHTPQGGRDVLAIEKLISNVIKTPSYGKKREREREKERERQRERQRQRQRQRQRDISTLRLTFFLEFVFSILSLSLSLSTRSISFSAIAISKQSRRIRRECHRTECVDDFVADCGRRKRELIEV